MSLMRKVGNAWKILRQRGPREVLSIVASKYCLPVVSKYALPILGPMNSRLVWGLGIRPEIRFWDDYFRTKGLEWSDTYGLRFDPDLPLQERPAALLPSEAEVRILDVGAGPLTSLGKKCEGKRLFITAVDPLAAEFDRLLEKYGIQPLVRTENLAAENLTDRFAANTFDLVYARNSIDHAFDPEKAILRMIDVAKSGRYVLLEHKLNEAENENYSGFHQWNFSVSEDGDFLIRSKFKEVNMSRKYEHLCSMRCELETRGENGEWLITTVEKR
jgi:SAM-dependent methyltransferase